MRRKILSLLLSVVAAALVLSAARAVFSADDPLVGTWTLDIAKSSFSPGPALKSATAKFEASGDGFQQTVNVVDAQDNPATYVISIHFDGKDYPVTGDPSRDAASWKRIDAQTFEGVNKKAGQVVTAQRRVIAPDGNTMTLTTTGTDAQGQPVMNVEFFEKQVAASSAPSSGAGNAAADGSSVDKGKALYASYRCFDCHGMNGEGTDAAPNLTATRLTPDQIKGFLEHPSPDARGAGMPNIDADSPDLQPLVDYVVSLKRTQ